MENFEILKFWDFPQSEIEQLVNKIEVIAIYYIWKQIRLEPKKTYIFGECVHNERHTQKQNLYLYLGK